MTPSLEYASTKVGMTRARFGVIAFIVGLAVVTYLDRTCISTLTENVQADFHLNKDQMAWVFSSFAISYALFEVPTAWWAHRRGTRRVLTRIVLWWTLLTLATAAVITPEGIARLFPSLATPVAAASSAVSGTASSQTAPAIVGTSAWVISFWMMLSVRFLFGMGEAGAWPCAAASYARWIPAKERGFAQGMLFAGAHIAGGLTPFLVIFMRDTLHVPWRMVFVIFGVVGFAWAIAWYAWFRDDPSEHKGVGPAELKLIVEGRREQTEEHGGWAYCKRLFLNRNMIPLCLMYIGNAYAYYFCITWLPTFLKEKHGFEKTQLGIAAGLPLTLSVVGDIFGGLTTDYLTKRFGPRIGRSALGAACYGLAAICMLVAATATNPWLAISFLAVAVALVMFTLGAAWGAVIDVSGKHTGMVGAIMNTAGNTASIFSPLVAVYTMKHSPDWYWLWNALDKVFGPATGLTMKSHIVGWNAPLYVIGGLFAVGAISWCFVNPRKHIF